MSRCVEDISGGKGVTDLLLVSVNIVGERLSLRSVVI